LTQSAPKIKPIQCPRTRSTFQSINNERMMNDSLPLTTVEEVPISTDLDERKLTPRVKKQVDPAIDSEQEKELNEQRPDSRFSSTLVSLVKRPSIRSQKENEFGSASISKVHIVKLGKNKVSASSKLRSNTLTQSDHSEVHNPASHEGPLIQVQIYGSVNKDKNNMAVSDPFVPTDVRPVKRNRSQTCSGVSVDKIKTKHSKNKVSASSSPQTDSSPSLHDDAPIHVQIYGSNQDKDKMRVSDPVVPVDVKHIKPNQSQTCSGVSVGNIKTKHSKKKRSASSNPQRESSQSSNESPPIHVQVYGSVNQDKDNITASNPSLPVDVKHVKRDRSQPCSGVSVDNIKTKHLKKKKSISSNPQTESSPSSREDAPIHVQIYGSVS